MMRPSGWFLWQSGSPERMAVYGTKACPGEAVFIQFAAIYIAELCAGTPEVMRGEVVEL